MTGLPWFKFYSRDWISGTRGLSDRARGIYVDLLARIYDLGRPLDYDERDLCRFLGYRDRRQLASVLNELVAAGKITIADGKITNGRAMAELAKSDRQREAGKKGGRPKTASRTAPDGDLDAILRPSHGGDFEQNQVNSENPPEPEPEPEPERSKQVGRASDPDDPEIDEAIRLWNELADRIGLARVQKITAERRKRLAACLQDAGGLPGWRAALCKIEASPFLRGENDRGWRADFDFIVRERSFTRLMEGAYSARRDRASGNGFAELQREMDRRR